MKQTKEYSEKEKAIFKGIMDLLNQGYRIHEMKVADIAAAAGIGKGTVYEYFATKEEIIREAISYHVYQEYERLTALITEQPSLIATIVTIMDYLVDMLRTRFSSFLFMVLDLGQSDIKQLISEDSNLFTEIRSGVLEHIEQMYKKGKEENLIGENVAVKDFSLVVYGIIAAFTNEVIFLMDTRKDKNLKNSDDLLELKERAIKLILKALK
mgnify:FL=1